MALTIQPAIDAVLPCTNYIRNMDDVPSTDLSDLLPILVRSLTGVILVTRLTSGARPQYCYIYYITQNSGKYLQSMHRCAYQYSML